MGWRKGERARRCGLTRPGRHSEDTDDDWWPEMVTRSLMRSDTEVVEEDVLGGPNKVENW